MIHFKLILKYSVKKGSNVIPAHVLIYLSQHHLLKRLFILSPLNCLGTSVKNQLTKNIEFISRFKNSMSFAVFQFYFIGLHVFSSVAQSCLTLCDPMNRSTPGLPVYHQLPESIQTHVHWVGDAIQPSHSLSSLSPPVLNLSQHHSLFQWVSSSHQVAKVLEFQL